MSNNLKATEVEMLGTAGKETLQESKSWMTDQCDELFRKWLVDLTVEEKEIWLWNAMVAMKRIEQIRLS